MFFFLAHVGDENVDFETAEMRLDWFYTVIHDAKFDAG